MYILHTYKINLTSIHKSSNKDNKNNSICNFPTAPLLRTETDIFCSSQIICPKIYIFQFPQMAAFFWFTSLGTKQWEAEGDF